MTGNSLDPVALRRARRAWVGFSIFTSLLVCSSVAMLYAVQAQALARAVDLGRDLKLARIDLFQGFLHVSLAESANSVWDRHRGLAYMGQAIRELQSASPRLVDSQTSRAMDRELQFLTAMVAARAEPAARSSLDLRLAFYRLNSLASEMDEEAEQEIARLRANGRWVFLAVLAGSGLLLGLVATGAVRAAAREEAALVVQQQADLRFRQLAENIGEVFWLRDIASGDVLFVNSAWRALWGRSPDDLLRDPREWLAAIHPEDSERMRARAAPGSAVPYEEEYRVVHPDGSIRWVRERTFPVHDADRRAYRIAGVAEDITQRKAAEASRAASERRLRDIIDLVPHLIYAKDPHGRFLLANRATARFLGHEVDEMLGRDLADLGVDSRYAQQAAREESELLASGSRIEGALMDRNVRGAHFTFMVNKMPFTFGDGAVDAVLVVATDVTGLRRAQGELKHSVALLEATLQSTDNGVMVCDARGVLLLWNARLLELLGTRDLAAGQTAGAVLAAFGIDPGSAPAAAGVAHRRDESFVEYHRETMRIDGQPSGYVWTFRDVSARELAAVEAQQREHELELRVEERTRELAQAYQELESFSHAVSHDLRAPLTAIYSFMRVLLGRHGGQLEPQARHYVEEALHASDNMREMIAALLQLAEDAQGPARRRPLDVTQAARRAYGVHADLLSGRRVEFEVQEGLRAYADPVLVATLLQNLIGNALKYSSGRDPARIEVGAEPGAVATFYVRDNGVGFDPAHAGRLFQPFSRLHSEEEFPGHGIGLATAARIVARHGGRIWAEAAVGRGATFRFTLDPHMRGA